MTSVVLSVFIVCLTGQTEPLTKDQVQRFYIARAAIGEESRWPFLSCDKMAVGHVGAMPTGDVVYKVLQVIDEQQALVTARIFTMQPKLLSNRIVTMAPGRTIEVHFIVRGISTKGLVDDRPIDLPSTYEVADTATYPTLEGTNTVFVLQPVELPKPPDSPKPGQANGDPKGFRIWTDATGSHKTEAVFLDFEAGKVVLQKPTGSIVRLSPSQLSKADQQYYRDVLKSNLERRSQAKKKKLVP